MPKSKEHRLQVARRNAKSDRERSVPHHTCPACGKKVYVSKLAARRDARRLFPGAQTREYECPSGSGWHFTSQVPRRDWAVFWDGGEFRVATADAEIAARYTAAVVAGTGAGPTWAELAAAMGWPRGLTVRIISALAKAGWLVTGRQPRSLRPGRNLTGLS